jgi:hypothetical protein
VQRLKKPRPRALLPAGVLAALLALTAAAPAEAKSCQGNHWVGAWAASPSNRGKESFSGQTLRVNLTPLYSGSTLRVRLSNRFGRRAVTFDSIYVGKQQSGAALVPGSNRQVLFHGKRTVTIPRGRDVRSDRVQLSFSALEHLAVSLYARGETGGGTEHFQAAQTSYFTPRGSGDHTTEEGARVRGAGDSSFALTAGGPRGTRGTVCVPLLGKRRTMAMDGRIRRARRIGDEACFGHVQGVHTFAWSAAP